MGGTVKTIFSTCLRPLQINHSCDPNYGRVWIDGTEQVVAFATRPIAKGEEICDAYSGIFGYADATERAG